MKKLWIILLCLLLALPACAEEVPSTSSFFDYDAIIADPDAYQGFYYSLVCNIVRINAVDMDIPNWTRPVMAVVTVDGDTGKVAHLVFNDPDGDFSAGDVVHTFVAFIHVSDTKSTFGFYIKMPLFLSYSIKHIEK